MPGTEETRRRLLLGGVALASVATGAGLAWWKTRPAPLAEGAPQALWAARFATPEGGELAVASLRGRPLLVNFWATWCPPCVEEMPLLDRFYRENSSSGWNVLGLAIDQPSAVRSFLGRLPVSFPIALAGLEGTELGRSLGNLTGGLPFTVVLGPDGAVRQRKMGQLSQADLAQWRAAAGAP